MREVTEKPELVAYCGLYCGACGAYLKERCKGCHENTKATWCKIRLCCIEKNYTTCADCGEFKNPKACKKVNNLMSKIFALIFKSDRAACIAQVKELGLLGHAKKMAAARTQTIKKK
ncbi:MAG: hypothetical protein A2487_00770 [Candidatus Raymondbacteria bacterium RifOxyC12_full_50_8]|uniref:DUF3795 domain-containing protein n=1 Tax=Candidatus Raymondbacteria bacterium RIFOXYD12_FULL_49_13 TaxID=1817890 RepID=A0A1F7F9M1_UNCRA|nr:MAG: hypothetical protein A2350_03315 [Candidatus Raymondbacteria bacterium RifOxyB12_full_50_8]OGJ93274.1 MAG: hypothetical protein A2248_17990 [Candidatus Raymondbacteria bacterium RIFOXYA2_FULL_49_16]OGJ98176.1 MAG: hypothetical protein A2487_00770 [Candidatus Raymondbacteria bacterium RifOxyC12_full_50_8]OGK03355.1 MAG: hypothetical protein A2519_15335 [Candidatus Raymondbacteria bacterium RIFOXYD12_FULL_49_13]OGP44996.1 MAG: hypothetical protein A2324_19915 [Candidatus Raymondbacteria b